jgi:hypothetical protein
MDSRTSVPLDYTILQLKRYMILEQRPYSQTSLGFLFAVSLMPFPETPSLLASSSCDLWIFGLLL